MSEESEICTPVSRWMRIGLNTFLHALILFGILLAFFHLYVSQLERTLLNNEFVHLIHQQYGRTVLSIPIVRQSVAQITQSSFIASILANLERQYQQEHSATQVYNQGLFRSAWILWSGLGVGLLLVFWILSQTCGQCVPIFDLFWENAVTFTLVGAMEVGFFLFVASKFVPVPPSLLAKTMLSRVAERIGANPPPPLASSSASSLASLATKLNLAAPV